MRIQGKEIKAFLLDMDGTMLDSMGMWYDIDVEFCHRHGYEMPVTLQKEIEGLSFTETAVYIKKRFQMPETIEEIMAEWDDMAYDQYAHHVALKSGVKEVLDWAKENGIRLGIGTSNAKVLAYAALNQHGLRDYFSCILTSDEVPNGKPAPDIYLKLAERLGVVPGACVVYEDLPAGLTAGNAAGMLTAGVEDSYSKDMREEKRQLADIYIDSYEDWLAQLQQAVTLE